MFIIESTRWANIWFGFYLKMHGAHSSSLPNITSLLNVLIRSSMIRNYVLNSLLQFATKENCQEK